MRCTGECVSVNNEQNEMLGRVCKCKRMSRMRCSGECVGVNG